MASTHENESGVTAGGYSNSISNNISTSSSSSVIDAIMNNFDSNGTYIGQIQANQIIEDQNKKFISGTDKYNISQLLSNAMLRSIYDTDGDGVVDYVEYSQTSGTANYANKAEESKKSDYATTSGLANRATIAEKAKTSENATKADKSNFATISESSNSSKKADTASRADFAYKSAVSDEATNALSVEWGAIKNIPNNLVKRTDLTWENIKFSAPEIIKDTNYLNDRIVDLEVNKHIHANKNVIDLIEIDSNGNPVWDGREWPNPSDNMRKSVYDYDNDGVVDRAKTVEWSDITNLPTFFTPTEHKHSSHDINDDSLHRFVSDIQIAKWNNKQDNLNYVPENTAQKGIPGGYAPLDATCKIPSAYIDNINWSFIENRPISLVNDIDEAVELKHYHINKNALDKIAINNENLPIWDDKEWPYAGDMKKSTYDADNDGVVDHALIADSIEWALITSRPRSRVIDIDDAVTKKHYHKNLSSLELIGVNSNGLPLWNNDEFPYDMRTSIYDINNDGIVNQADYANSVKWTNIENKPNSNITLIDDAVDKRHEHLNSNVLEKLEFNENGDRILFKGNEIAFKDDVKTITLDNGQSIQVKQSLEFDIDNKIHLDGDTTFIDPLMYYGTNENGVRGFYYLPKDISINLSDSFEYFKDEQTNKYTIKLKGENNESVIDNNAYYGTDKNGELGYHLLPNPIFESESSIDITDNNIIKLKNDFIDEPIPNAYYGTNENSELGWYNLQSSSVDSIEASKVIEDDDHKFITNELYNKLVNIDNTGSSTSTQPIEQVINNISNYTVSYLSRQTIINAMDNFFVLDGSDLIIKASELEPLVLSFSNGNNEIIKDIRENITITNIPSKINSGEAYIYAYIDNNDQVKFNKTEIKPIYSKTEPLNRVENQYWFDVDNYTMHQFDGKKFVVCDKPILFIGYIIANNSNIMAQHYSLNGVYDSGWYNVDYGTTYNKKHNIGSDLITVTAYRGNQNNNLGEFAFGIHNIALSDASPVGDRITKITDTDIQTTRYSRVIYNNSVDNVIYGASNQHRVIIKRAW